jgi:hypothetical protein
MSQLVNVKAVKASGEAAAVFRSTGGLWWFEQSGWPNETAVSFAVGLYIFGCFHSPPYDYKIYYNAGADVTKSNILSMIEYANSDFDYATFFIFANGVYYTDYDVIYYVVWPYGFPIYYIPVTHYKFYDALNASISDREIGWITYGGSTLHFVFLWTCVQANEIGSYHDSYWIYYPYYWYQGTGATGMPYAWTHRNYTQMSSNGYASPDTWSYCFIGFKGFAMPISEPIPDSGGKNYGDFVKRFYYHALEEGYSINNALDYASQDVFGVNRFNQTTLYNGYEKYLGEELGTWSGKMCVYGNGNNYLPH